LTDILNSYILDKHIGMANIKIITMLTELSRIVLLINKKMTEKETRIAATFGMGEREESIIDCARV